MSRREKAKSSKATIHTLPDLVLHLILNHHSINVMDKRAITEHPSLCLSTVRKNKVDGNESIDFISVLFIVQDIELNDEKSKNEIEKYVNVCIPFLLYGRALG